MFLLLFSIPLTAGTIYFAQVADGGGEVTTFTIINPTTSTATGTLNLKDGDGSPWSISLTDGTSGSQFSVSIPPMGSIRLTSSGAGPIKTGWAVLDSEADLYGVERFDYRPGSALQYSVGVIGNPSGKRFVLPVDTSSTSDTGFAVANIGTSNVAIQLTLRADDGSIFSSKADPRLNPLAAQKYLCLFASEMFPVLQSGPFKGLLIIEVVGAGDIAAMGLAFKEGQLSAIPIIALDSSKEKAERLLGHWIFAYTISSTVTDEYTLTYVYEDTTTPGEWYAIGTDEYGDIVAASWSDDLNLYTLLDEGILFDSFYTFDFTGSNMVSGCYYLSYSDGTMSDCYPMTGIRTSSSAQSSYKILQFTIETELKAMSEAQSLVGPTPTPNPAILKEMKRLRSLMRAPSTP
jgi:hypothetical protein